MLRSRAMVGPGSGDASSDDFARSTPGLDTRANGVPGRFRPLERSSTTIPASVVVLSLAAAACGTSSGTKTQAGSGAAVIAASGQHLAEALADGPDPDADPVGYALAQVKPLTAIHTSDKSLGAAIAGLASACQTFYADNGTKAVNALVTAASDRIDEFYPGATS